MRKQLFAAMIVLGSLASVLGACSSAKTTSTESSCDVNAKTLRTATNEKGTFMRDQNSGKYAVRVVTPNTIDEQNVYLICNPPAELPQENATVNFSGTVRTSKQVSNLGGLTYYDLEVSSLK